MAHSTQRLVLFDIDGTLVLDDGAARESFGIALEDVYAYDGDLGRYDFSGRTDPQIAHMVLADAGHSSEQIAASLPRLFRRYVDELSSRSQRDRIRVLPGVLPLLDLLSKNDDISLGLLTGNIEPGARVKLESNGLNAFFPFGAFGSDSMDREELPPVALARATQHSGRRFSPEEVVIIGDSVYDVRCGVPHGAITIAVASGRTSSAALAAENPDLLLESLEEVEKLMEVVSSR